MRLFGALLGCLFGLPFTLMGLYVANETVVPMVLDWQETRDWVSVDAKIIAVNGADNYTKADYEYNFQGNVYQSNRVYLADFNDNFGSYHQVLYSDLNHSRNNNQSVPIWINPTNPREAIIDKEMRWGLFSIIVAFTGVFVLIGLFICYASIRYKPSEKSKNKKRLEKLRRRWDRDTRRLLSGEEKQSFPEFVATKNPELVDFLDDERVSDDSWQERKSWKTNRIKSHALAGVIGMWVVSLFLIAIGTLIASKISIRFDRFDEEFVVGSIFSLVALLLILQTLRITFRYRRFGRVEFVMDPYPGSIGGDVGGYIDVKRLPYAELDPSAKQFKVTLECVYSYMSGSGKNRSRSESIKWAEEGAAEVQRSVSGVMLSFKFSVPEHLPEASVAQNGDYYFWRLKVYGDLPGFDLKREYNIPVFATNQKSTTARNDISEQVSELKKEASEEKARAVEQGNFHLTDLSKVVRVDKLGDGLSMYFPMFRNKGLTLFAWVFAGGFGFATYGINSQMGGGLGGVFMFLFSIPFALVALAASIASIYLPFNNLKTRVSRTELRSIRKILFIPVSSKTVSTHAITGLKLKKSGSTGQGVKKIEHFKIIASSVSDGDITVAEDINGEDLAEHFKNYLAAQMGLEAERKNNS